MSINKKIAVVLFVLSILVSVASCSDIQKANDESDVKCVTEEMTTDAVETQTDETTNIDSESNVDDSPIKLPTVTFNR